MIKIRLLKTGSPSVKFEVRQAKLGASRACEIRAKNEVLVAKTTYVKSQNVWKVYWRRQDLKWHPYPPVPQVRSLAEFLALVEEGENACFFGLPKLRYQHVTEA